MRHALSRSRALRAFLFALLPLGLAEVAGAQSLSITNLVNQQEPLNPPATLNWSFTVTLSPPSGQTVTVDWATADDTALAGADYIAASGTLTFVPGDTSETISVTVNADLIDEPNEDFLVNLSNPVNATIADPQGRGRIRDNGDGPPNLTIDNVAVMEGGVATFSLTLSLESGHVIDVNWTTANGSATAPGDYGAASGSRQFLPGETTKTVAINTFTDSIAEGPETFFLNLSTGDADVNIADSQGMCTIDDSVAPSISIADVTVVEGDGGNVDAVFQVTLSGASVLPVAVNWAAADNTAIAPGDYAAGNGIVTFVAGDTVETVTVAVAGDLLDELDETFVVNLTSPSNATIADGEAVGTITDDDDPPAISIADVTVTEGDSGTVGAVFNVTLSAVSGRTVTADWATADGSATAPSDYVSGSGAVIFVAGDTAETITVSVNGDLLDEPDEGFFVNLTNLVDVTAADVQGQGTIENDETALVAAALTVDASSGPGTDGNGIFEPGETGVVVSPAWENAGPDPLALTGSAVTFDGPVGGTYSIDDATADYGTIPVAATASCAQATDNCFALSASAAARPMLHWDAVLEESLSSGDQKDWTLHLGDSFGDVPRGSSFYPFVETILHNLITGGCGGESYCPEDPTTREQMAVFLLRAADGPSYTPPACTIPVFSDVPCGSPYAPWINELSARSVTGGCGPGVYCPTSPVTREQMAVFLLRTLEGPAYVPPACGTPTFGDVPCSSIYAAWVNEIAARGITAGCGGGNYCPADAVTRGQMAVFLTVTFDLSIYAP